MHQKVESKIRLSKKMTRHNLGFFYIQILLLLYIQYFFSNNHQSSSIRIYKNNNNNNDITIIIVMIIIQYKAGHIIAMIAHGSTYISLLSARFVVSFVHIFCIKNKTIVAVS